MGRLPRATKRRDFIKRLKELGWTGPVPGHGKHPEFMEKRGHRPLGLPNPHKGDIRLPLLSMLLDQAGISREEWLGKKPKE